MRTFGLSHDDARTTPVSRLRYDACISVSGDVSASEPFELRTLEGGRFAVAMHRGPYENLGETYAQLLDRWLPESGEQPRSAPCMEFYMNDPSTVLPEDLLTELWVPLA